MVIDQSALAASLTAQIVAVNAAISTVGTLQGASLTVLSTVIAAVESALPVFDAGIAALDADIDEVNAGGVTTGIPGPAIVAALNTQASEVSQLATLLTARSYLARAGVNIEESPG